ncbi:MAG: ATP-binding protein [Methyloligellaceae bacterium]
MVIFTVLASVVAMPMVGLVFFRIYENQLINQTESELIAQGAALSAIYADEFKTRRAFDTPVGALQPEHLRPDPKEPYHPIVPRLDMTSDYVLPRRPSTSYFKRPLHPTYEAIGKRLFAITHETQKTTLAGFRILDYQGVVIGAKYKIGHSLAHVEEVAKALKGEYTVVLRERISDEPPPPLYSISRGTGIRVFIAMPVIVDHHVIGIIYMARTPNNIIKHLYAHQRKVAVVACTLLALTLIIGFIFWRAIAGPVYELTRRTSKIANGDRQAILPLERHGTAEIAQLSQSFLNMAQNLFDRADYISTFAAHVSHELKSPLTSIQGAAELLQDANDTMTPEERERFLKNITTDTERLTALLSRLRELARADNPETSGSTEVQPLIQELHTHYGSNKITAKDYTDSSLKMSRENALIVFSHLIDNAIQHGATKIVLEAKQEEGHIHITVSDNGKGVSPQNREKIFEAFFTTRRESGGTGMGLGIVQSLLLAHEGEIALLPSTSGARFKIIIPEVA